MNREKVKGFAYLFSIGTLNFQRFGDFQGTFKRHLICYRCISILNLCERMNARQRILGSLFISRASQNSPVLTKWWFGPRSRCHLLILLSPAINVQWEGGCICVWTIMLDSRWCGSILALSRLDMAFLSNYLRVCVPPTFYLKWNSLVRTSNCAGSESFPLSGPFSHQNLHAFFSWHQGLFPPPLTHHTSSSILENHSACSLRKIQPGPASSGKSPSLTLSHPVRMNSHTAVFFTPVSTLHLPMFYLAVFPFSCCESSEDRDCPHDSDA